jgi:hypothetical protein
VIREPQLHLGSLGLGFTPVACVERLPEPLATDIEVCVPSFTAFYESHSFHLSFSIWTPFVFPSTPFHSRPTIDV